MKKKRRNFSRREKQRSWTIAGAVALLLLLVSWKKKPEPTVIVGDGKFGDFGTDGSFDDILQDVVSPNDLRTPSYVPSSLVKSVGKSDNGYLFKDSVRNVLVKSGTYEAGCRTCFK